MTVTLSDTEAEAVAELLERLNDTVALEGRDRSTHASVWASQLQGRAAEPDQDTTVTNPAGTEYEYCVEFFDQDETVSIPEAAEGITVDTFSDRSVARYLLPVERDSE